MKKIYTRIKDRSSVYNYLKAGFNGSLSPGVSYTVIKFVETFSDEECTIRECHSARRSMEDLISIVQTVFPEATEKDVIDAMFQMYDEGGMATYFCPDIKKHVFFRTSVKLPSPNRNGTFHHVTNERRNGKYSLEEIYIIARRDLKTTRKWEELLPMKLN